MGNEIITESNVKSVEEKERETKSKEAFMKTMAQIIEKYGTSLLDSLGRVA